MAERRPNIDGAVEVANTVEPKNNGNFPIAYADRIELQNGKNVEEAIVELEQGGNFEIATDEDIDNIFE